MISNNDFRRILSDKSLDLSKEELEQIIDEELEKSEDIMDADLIEYCLDALNELNSDESLDVEKGKVGDTNGKRIKRRYKRIAAIAAAAALLFAGAVSVSALVFNVNLFDSIVEFYDDHIRIRFDNSNDKANEYKLLGSELAGELADNGITPVLLPEEILTKECKISSVTYDKTEGIVSANIYYTQNGKDAYMTIDQYDSEDAVPYTDYLHSGEKIEMIEISNLSAYIMEQNGKGTIAYQDCSTVYYIVTQLSFEETIEFAKTIK